MYGVRTARTISACLFAGRLAAARLYHVKIKRKPGIGERAAIPGHWYTG